MSVTDRSGYPILVGAHVTSDRIPGHKEVPKGVVHWIEDEVVWIYTTFGYRPIPASRLKVVRVSSKRRKRQQWVNALERDQVLARTIRPARRS